MWQGAILFQDDERIEMADHISDAVTQDAHAPFVLQFPDFPDLPMYLHTLTDTWISDYIRGGQTFEPHIVALLRSLIRPGDTVLDVGANIQRLLPASALANRVQFMLLNRSQIILSCFNATLRSHRARQSLFMHALLVLMRLRQT